jgi:hypothetical protein
MDVSNGTDEDTHYRTGSGTTKEVTWTTLRSRETHHCADPKGSCTIYFTLRGGETLSQTFTEPPGCVSLVKNGNNYRINVTRSSAKKTAA